MPPYFPIDYTALSKARSDANKARHAVEREKYMGNYDLPSDVLARTHTALAGLSRKARRKAHRDAAELNLLAVQDPASGASVRDRLTAAQASAKIAGLMREEVKVSVTHSLGFKGFQGLEGSVIDAVPLPPTSPTVALPALPGDGAKSGG